MHLEAKNWWISIGKIAVFDLLFEGPAKSLWISFIRFEELEKFWKVLKSSQSVSASLRIHVWKVWLKVCRVGRHSTSVAIDVAALADAEFRSECESSRTVSPFCGEKSSAKKCTAENLDDLDNLDEQANRRPSVKLDERKRIHLAPDLISAALVTMFVVRIMVCFLFVCSIPNSLSQHRNFNYSLQGVYSIHCIRSVYDL